MTTDSSSALTTAAFTTSICRDALEYAALEGEWEALRHRSASATPFQSHAWLWSWWRSYGKPGRLRVVLARRNGVLVAAAPLMLVRRPLPALILLGGDISDFRDVLLDDNCPEAAEALVQGLREAARGTVIDLREVRPGSAAERLYSAWQGPRRRFDDSACLELPAVPMEDLVRRLAPPSAKRTRRKLRRIEAFDVRERAVPASEVPDAVRTLLRLHALQWRGRGVTPEHLRPRFGAHLTLAVQRLVAGGEAMVTEYLLQDEVVACDITLTSAELACGYLYGAHPRLREQKIDIATMLLRHDADHAFNSGRRTLSLLRGTEPYKLRWLPQTIVNQRFLLARRELTPVLGLHAAQVVGRTAAAGVLGGRVEGARALLSRLPGPRRPDAAG